MIKGAYGLRSRDGLRPMAIGLRPMAASCGSACAPLWAARRTLAVLIVLIEQPDHFLIVERAERNFARRSSFQ